MTPSLRCRTFLTRVPVLQAPKLRQLPDMTEPLGHLTAQRRETSMKTSVSFAYCLAIAMMVFASNCDAQQPYVSGAIGAGGQICEPANGIATGMAPIQTPWPGRVWFGTNFADQAVGYEGIYASLGLKTRLCEDLLDGRWLTEARLHQSLDGGGFFTNIGLERVFSIDSANADVTVGAWFDYDAGTNKDFSHTFYQVGVNAAIKSRNWDLIGNGYFPTDTAGYTQGDPNGNVPFYQHHIVLIPGIDTALEGFDTTLRIRPPVFAYLNGSVDVGAYGYSSDIIEFFAGGRTRLNAQLWDGLIVSGEIAYDDRFDLTGAVNLTYMFGVNARGSEYAGIGRDLERTVRNDRIVRYNQEVVYAIDPDTGAPYNVWHVNNSVDPLALQDGTFENPFKTLAQAEAPVSKENDIIFVDEGNGTVEGYDTGIQLVDHQMLLGDGVRHLIPIGNGLPWGDFYELIYHLDNNRPAITGDASAAVNLLNDNVVRGFIIDGNQSPSFMSYGIFGSPIIAGQRINGATIEDNRINGAVLDGVHINTAEGVLAFRRNLIGEFSVGPGADLPNLRDGIFIEDFVGPLAGFGSNTTGQLVLQDNNIVGNFRDGVHLHEYRLQHRDRTVPLDEQEVGILVENNNFSNNLRDGIRISENLFSLSTAVGVDTNTTDIDMIGNQTTFNGDHGINITNDLALGLGWMGGGRVRLLENDSSNNSGAGIRVKNWTNTRSDDATLIASRAGELASDVLANGRGIEVMLGDPLLPNNGWNQNLVVQGANIDFNNGLGLRATVNGVGAVMNTEIIDNISISGNGGGGIRLTGIGGATHNAIIENSAAGVGNTTLDMLGNGASGIAIVAGDVAGGNTGSVHAVIRNVDIIGSGNHGIDVAISDDGQATVVVEDVFSQFNSGNGMNIVSDTVGDTPAGVISPVSVIVLDDAFMNDNGGSGLNLMTEGGKTDLLVTGSEFNRNGLGAAGGHGIEVTANSSLLADPVARPDLMNFTRVQFYGNQMNGNTLSGLGMLSRGRANLFATVDSNQMLDNGFTFEERVEFFFIPPHFRRVVYAKLSDRGVDASAWDESTFTLSMTNNFISGNGEEGVHMYTHLPELFGPPQTARLVANMADNTIVNNDVWDIPTATPPRVSAEREIVMTNGTNAEFWLAMSNNTLSIVPPTGLLTPTFFNYGPPINFKIGLDGVTNGFGPLDLQYQNFQFTSPYNAVVGPAVLGTEAQFLAEGFPLMGF